MLETSSVLDFVKKHSYLPKENIVCKVDEDGKIVYRYEKPDCSKDRCINMSKLEDYELLNGGSVAENRN